MERKKRRKKITMTLSEIGFAMKHESSKVEGNVMVIEKKLWLEIAQLLMDTGRKLDELNKEIDELLGGV